MTNFHYEVNDGVAVISWNTPLKYMNIMCLQSLSDLEKKIDEALSDGDVVGIIIASGKKSFSGGLDLGSISKISGIISDNSQENLFKGLGIFSHLARKIERAGMNNKDTSSKPIICVLHGDALGIGFEIALSCHKIFVSDNPDGKLGLPDILIGMPPLAGSASRLFRKIDKKLCTSLLQNGETINFKDALNHNLIDEIKSPDELMPYAMQWIKTSQSMNIVNSWDIEKHSYENKIHQSFSSLEHEIKQANEKSNQKGIHPSFVAMLEDLYKNVDMNFDQALQNERNWLVNILSHSTQNSMVKTLFHHKPALEKGASRPSGIKHIPIKKVGILGAGMMGAGIAFVSAKADIDVVLLDQNQEGVDRGLLSVKRLLDQGVKRDKFSEADAKEILKRIFPSTEYKDLKECDLIIEAVFEDPKIKLLVTKSVEVEISKGVIFATNTSTLPISELAKASRDQSRYIGIHFFSPVHLMNLVEIIKGKNTGDKAVAVALDFVKQIKKTPIVVNDERYFYANRCILPYINEGIRMLDEGFEPGLIDDAAKLMGMPVGPLQLADEISIELCLKIMKATRAAMGDTYPYSAADTIVEKMCDDGRMGRKNLKGFYVYDKNGKRSGFWEGLTTQWPSSNVQPDITDVKCRLAMIQTLEALRALEEGVLEDIREGDVGAVLGWGFQPWTGGPFGWIDMIGTERAINICENLAKKFGPRFNAPDLLYKQDKLGVGFYLKEK